MATQHNDGLRDFQQKRHCQELEHGQTEMNQSTDSWLAGYDGLFVGDKLYPI